MWSEVTPVLLSVWVFDLVTNKPVVGATAEMKVDAVDDITELDLI